jgi:hypothetical protein
MIRRCPHQNFNRQVVYSLPRTRPNKNDREVRGIELTQSAQEHDDAFPNHSIETLAWKVIGVHNKRPEVESDAEGERRSGGWCFLVFLFLEGQKHKRPEIESDAEAEGAQVAAVFWSSCSWKVRSGIRSGTVETGWLR